MRNVKRTAACLFTVLVVASVSSAWAGQMRFAKAPLNGPTSGSFVTDFKAGDPIYAVVEFDDTLGDEMGSRGERNARLIEACATFKAARGTAKCLTVDIKPDRMSRKWIAFTIIPALR